MKEVQSDFLVLGSGVAGLTFAIKAAEKFPETIVCIITKSGASESNTKYAQGGMAAVLDLEDSFESHIADTLKAGDYLNDPRIVELVVKRAPQVLKDMMLWGANFDLNKSGDLDLAREGGHSVNRVVHHKDITGFEIEKTLLEKVNSLSNIIIHDHHFAIDLITEHQLPAKVVENSRCYGAYVLDELSGEVITYKANKVLLATGGAGQVYEHTTNPEIATGDGIAMAYRAKAKVSNMEFIQFHPTALYEPDKSPAFLISEAVRGFGAHLINDSGERFMKNYDSRIELASRDIVSRAIDNELKISGAKCVYLDCRHLDKKAFLEHFPNIYTKCNDLGINPLEKPIPVVPATHYICGGVEVDYKGQTTIQNLYACGECAHTGLHGANRLASNSLLEAMVMGNLIVEHLELEDVQVDMELIPYWKKAGAGPLEEKIWIGYNRKAVQRIMHDLVAIVRSDKRLLLAKRKLEALFTEIDELYRSTLVNTPLCELRNLVCLALMITNQSLLRKENKGAFYNKDIHEKTITSIK